MIVLKLAGALALLAGVTVEVGGFLPGAAGVAGNVGAVVAVALWALAAFERKEEFEEKGR